MTVLSPPADGLRFLNENVRQQKGRAAVGDLPPDNQTVIDREAWRVGVLSPNTVFSAAWLSRYINVAQTGTRSARTSVGAHAAHRSATGRFSVQVHPFATQKSTAA